MRGAVLMVLEPMRITEHCIYPWITKLKAIVTKRT